MKRVLRGTSRLDAGYVPPSWHPDNAPPVRDRTASIAAGVFQFAGLLALLVFMIGAVYDTVVVGGADVWSAQTAPGAPPCGYSHDWLYDGLAAALPWLVMMYILRAVAKCAHLRATAARAWWFFTKLIFVCVLYTHAESAAEFAGCVREPSIGRFMSRTRPTKRPKEKPEPRPDWAGSAFTDDAYDFMIMDSGCTTTILSDPAMFTSLRPSTARVQTADGKIVRIAQEGPAIVTVVDNYNTERTVHLPRAFYCPDMHTLLSVKQLVLLDHDVTFSRKRGSRLEIGGAPVQLHERDNLYQVRYRTHARTPDQLRAAHAAHDDMVAHAQRQHEPKRYVLELCAGTSSAVKFHLRDSPHTHGMSVDVRDEAWMRTHISDADQDRFTPVCMDVKELTYERLDKLTHTVWGVPLSRVDVIHHSPMCESLSSASRQSHTVHFSDGYSVPESDVAKYHLACLDSVFAIFTRLTRERFQGVISAENPYSGFHRLPSVRALAAQAGVAARRASRPLLKHL